MDDAQAAVDHFVAHGCTTYEEPMDTGDGIVVATVKKSNDQLLGLIYNPRFERSAGS